MQSTTSTRRSQTLACPRRGWKQVVVCGCLWWYVAVVVCGCLWLSVVACGCGACGGLWLFVAVAWLLSNFTHSQK